jgi:hypothetical protein
MDASQLQYPKTVHSVPNTSLASFYLSKVSEMLRNTPKHHYGSNGVEWMLHNFGTPKQRIQSRNTSFASFTCRRLVKNSETLPNIILGRMEMFHNFVPRNSAFRLGTLVLHLVTCRRLAKCSETLPNINLGRMG